jgi:glycosyltransferase involved in cell wall biosynthesis
MVRSYIRADPLRPLREAAAMRLAVNAEPGRGVLHVIHDHGGGTETHVRALIAGSREHWRHYLAIAVGERWQIEEHRVDGDVVTFDLERDAGEEWDAFVGGICASFGISLIHLHNISACREGILSALETLPVRTATRCTISTSHVPRFTFLAADGMYCGAQTETSVCSRCLAAQPTFDRVDIGGWRARHHALLRRAAFRIAPSQWAADTLRRYFPDCPPTVIAHGSSGRFALLLAGMRTLVMLPKDDIPSVAVLGAIGPTRARAVSSAWRNWHGARGAAVRFVLIGYLDVQRGPWQSDDAVLTVHGRYDTADLPDLLAHYRVAMVLYPSAGPETFSYTLTEAWAAGRPVLVPPIGALAERVRDSGAGWIMTDAQWRDEAQMLDRLCALLAASERESIAAASIAHARCRLPH